MIQIDREVLPLVKVQRRVFIQPDGLPVDQPSDPAQLVGSLHFALLQKGQHVVGIDLDHLDIHRGQIDGPERQRKIPAIGKNRTADGNLDGRRKYLLLQVLHYLGLQSPAVLGADQFGEPQHQIP